MDGLRRDIDTQRDRYQQSGTDDLRTRVVIAGEAVDLIDRVESADAIIKNTVEQAEKLLRGAADFVVA